jgi:hypothetical protein
VGPGDPSAQGENGQEPIIPTTGAAKYWYVDPRATADHVEKSQDTRAQLYDLMNNYPSDTKPADAADALKRLQLLPPNASTGF